MIKILLLLLVFIYVLKIAKYIIFGQESSHVLFKHIPLFCIEHTISKKIVLNN